MSRDLEGRAVQGLVTFLSLVLLNVLYLLCCLPVITIGAATSALYEVMLRFADEERGYPVRDFLRALVRNLGRGTAVWLLLGLPLAALLFAARFWVSSGSVVSLLATVAAALAACYVAAALLHGLALVAAYREGVGRTLRNALLLPGAEPLRSAGLVVVPAVVIALTLVAPGFVWIALTVGASASALLSALILRPLYRDYTPSA